MRPCLGMQLRPAAPSPQEWETLDGAVEMPRLLCQVRKCSACISDLRRGLTGESRPCDTGCLCKRLSSAAQYTWQSKPSPATRKDESDTTQGRAFSHPSRLHEEPAGQTPAGVAQRSMPYRC